MKTMTEKLAGALRKLAADDSTLISHCADNGDSPTCCGGFIKYKGRWGDELDGIQHSSDCDVMAARAALAEYDAEQQATP